MMVVKRVYSLLYFVRPLEKCENRFGWLKQLEPFWLVKNNLKNTGLRAGTIHLQLR